MVLKRAAQHLFNSTVHKLTENDCSLEHHNCWPHLVFVGCNKIECLIWIIEDGESQLQHLLTESERSEITQKTPSDNKNNKKNEEHEVTLFCFRALFSFMWGQSFPVTTDLISDTGTRRNAKETRGVWSVCVYCWKMTPLEETQGFFKFLTFVTEEFKRHFTLRRLVEVPVVQHFVIQWESTEPKLLYKRRRGKTMLSW